MYVVIYDYKTRPEFKKKCIRTKINIKKFNNILKYNKIKYHYNNNLKDGSGWLINEEDLDKLLKILKKKNILIIYSVRKKCWYYHYSVSGICKYGKKCYFKH